MALTFVCKWTGLVWIESAGPLPFWFDVEHYFVKNILRQYSACIRPCPDRKRQSLIWSKKIVSITTTHTLIHKANYANLDEVWWKLVPLLLIYHFFFIVMSLPHSWSICVTIILRNHKDTCLNWRGDFFRKFFFILFFLKKKQFFCLLKSSTHMTCEHNICFPKTFPLPSQFKHPCGYSKNFQFFARILAK